MEPEQTRGRGRPANKLPSREVNITSMDPVTFRMLDALEGYGRFGRSKQDIALFIIRTWLWENESRLKAAIAASEIPLGPVHQEIEE